MADKITRVARGGDKGGFKFSRGEVEFSAERLAACAI